jgi:hypothetical protein
MRISRPTKFTASCLIFALLLLALALPNFVNCKRRDPFEGNSCISRLKMIGGSKETWRIDHPKNTNDVISWDDIRPYLSYEGKAIPVCPAGGTYTLGRLSESPTCSIPEHKLP